MGADGAGKGSMPGGGLDLERHHLDPHQITSAGRGAFLFASIINALLFIIKIVSAYIGKSDAMYADAIDTLSDYVSTIFFAWAYAFSRRPPDQNHPYGHGKADPLMAGFSSIILFLLAGNVIWSASHRLMAGAATEPNLIAFGAALVSIITKELLYRSNVRVGREIGSEVVVADAWHHRVDALTSLVAAIGISLTIWLGSSLWFADGVAAIIIALMVIGVGISISFRAASQLMDAAVPEKDLLAVKEIARETPGVLHVAEVRVRKMGTIQTADLKIEVNGMLTVIQGHDIAIAVRDNIQKRIPAMQNVFIHVEPDGHERWGPLR